MHPRFPAKYTPPTLTKSLSNYPNLPYSNHLHSLRRLCSICFLPFPINPIRIDYSDTQSVSLHESLRAIVYPTANYGTDPKSTPSSILGDDLNLPPWSVSTYHREVWNFRFTWSFSHHKIQVRSSSMASNLSHRLAYPPPTSVSNRSIWDSWLSITINTNPPSSHRFAYFMPTLNNIRWSLDSWLSITIDNDGSILNLGSYPNNQHGPHPSSRHLSPIFSNLNLHVSCNRMDMLGMNIKVNYKSYKSQASQGMINLTGKTMGVHERPRLASTQLSGSNHYSFDAASARLSVSGLGRSPRHFSPAFPQRLTHHSPHHSTPHLLIPPHPHLTKTTSSTHLLTESATQPPPLQPITPYKTKTMTSTNCLDTPTEIPHTHFTPPPPTIQMPQHPTRLIS